MLSARSFGGVISVNLTTGGSGYASAPTVAFSGGGGTGASAVAQMAGTVVSGIVITNRGSGYTSAPAVTISAATGSGAAAGADVFAGTARRMAFFQGRTGDVYGVDGMGRGIRIACGAATADPIGMQSPAVGPAVTASTTAAARYVSEIVLVRQGAGYHAAPTVVLTGGSPSTPAAAKAVMTDGRIQGVVITGGGAGYSSAPKVSFQDGFPASVSLTVNVSGGVRQVPVVATGSGYVSNATTSPSVVFSTAQGLTNALALPIVNELGQIAGIQILAAGTGATTTGVTASIVGGGGAGAVVAVDMSYSIVSVSVVSGGTNHLVPPVLTVVPAAADYSGGGGDVVCGVSGGVVTACTVLNGGYYSLPPQCIVSDTQAEAVAVMAPVLRGTYWCAYRYIDDANGAGPIPSSISEMKEIEIPSGADNLTWTLSHDAADSRATAVELWRTSADQSVVLYRVATLRRTAGVLPTTYVDSLSDPDLQDTERSGYGLMPVTLPSGQLNARRFGVPPGNYGVAVMFQDRAWYAVDTTGRSVNSLLFSEVDEPESVPTENELVLQESVGEYDSIVALIPLGSELLIAQTGHLYSLRYVAQPIFDASVTLVAYRGVLSNACWTILGGVAFFADSHGIYAFDGQKETPVSAAIDNLFRDGTVDFSKRDKFHMSSDFSTKTVRFHYCKSSDTEPVRALCYCLATEAWWEEVYATAVTASAPAVIANRRGLAYGTADGGFVRPVPGASDSGTDIQWRFRTGNMALNNEPSRAVGVLYNPTSADCSLGLAVHFNGSSSPRSNAIASSREDGFVATNGTPESALNMSANRSPLGKASGFARAMFAGRLDPRSAGADRHIAVAFAGTQGGGDVKIHAVTVEGAG